MTKSLVSNSHGMNFSFIVPDLYKNLLVSKANPKAFLLKFTPKKKNSDTSNLNNLEGYGRLIVVLQIKMD